MKARRRVLAGLALLAALPRPGRAGTEREPDRRWYEAALRQRERAESWGDQSYGAVLVQDGRLIGEGPSRVVQRGDPDAHAEREALRDAEQRLGRAALRGSVLYSTSRPCAACEAAAAAVGVRRMFFGPALSDAGAPRR